MSAWKAAFQASGQHSCDLQACKAFAPCPGFLSPEQWGAHGLWGQVDGPELESQLSRSHLRTSPQLLSFSELPVLRPVDRDNKGQLLGLFILKIRCDGLCLFEGNAVGEGTTRTGTATPVHHPQRPVGSTHSSTMGLKPPEHQQGLLSSCSAEASHCYGFSCWEHGCLGGLRPIVELCVEPTDLCG